MNEERLKILEMLSQGKITVEEAARLLEALGEPEPAPTAGESRHWRREHRRRRRRHGDWDDLAEGMEDLGQEIRTRVEQARETLRASMPGVKKAIEDAIPGGFTVSMPDVGRIVRDAVRSATETVSEWTDVGFDAEEDRYPEKAERETSETCPVEPGARLVLRTPGGNVQVETWDRKEAELNARIVVHAKDEETARAFVEQIRVQADREPSVLRVQALVPEPANRPSGIGRCAVHFLLRLPKRIDLDLRTAHGNVEIPAIEGAAVLHNRHGKTSLEKASGNVWIGHAHGAVTLGEAGADLTLETRHGHVQVETVSGAALLQVRHGNLNLGTIGKNLELSISHGSLTLNSAEENAAVNAGHCPVRIQRVGGRLTLQARHSPVAVDSVTGDVQAANSHGPLTLNNIGGNLVAQNSHGPVDVEGVAGQATVKTDHARIRLTRIAGGATVENSHGPVELEEVAGPVAARASRGSVRIIAPGAEVLTQVQGGGIRVHPHGPVQADYTLQTQGGDIDLILPEGSALDVRGRVNRGHIRTDLPLSVEGRPGASQSVTGQLNNGNARLTVDIDRGNLNLMQQEKD